MDKTENFPTKLGTKEGISLSPILFNKILKA